MYILALLLNYQGKHEEAEAIYRRTLELKVKVLGQKHPKTLISLHDLAGLLYRQRRYRESCLLYERAYPSLLNTLGGSHPTTVICSKNYKSSLKAMEQVGILPP